VKDTKRAERRHHNKNLVKRYTKVAQSWNVDSPEETGRKMKDHPKLCSCAMCGNPRNSNLYRGKGKLTKQELKQIDREKSE
jgi:hypothetical protein